MINTNSTLIDSYRKFLPNIFGIATAKALQMGATFILTFFLAKTMSVSDFGIYALAISIATLLIQPVTLAISTISIKSLAAYCAAGQFGHAKGAVAKSIIVSLIIYTSVSIMAAFVTRIDELEHIFPLSTQPVLAALACLSLAGLAYMPAAWLQGLNKVALGQYIESMVPLLILIATIALFISSANLSLYAVFLTQGLSAAFSILVAAALFYKTGATLLGRRSAIYQYRDWFKDFVPLVAATLVFIANSQIDLLILGLKAGPSSVAEYRVGMQLALLITMPLIVVNAVISPQIASTFELNDLTQTQRLLAYSTAISVVCSAVVFSVLCFFYAPIMGKVFGDKFTQFDLFFVILCCSQLINSCCGPVTQALNMTGNQREVLKGALLAGLLNVVLAPSLIEAFAIRGAGLSNLISMSLLNIFLIYRLRVTTSLRVGPFLLQKRQLGPIE